jgi:hypothetical protein
VRPITMSSLMLAIACSLAAPVHGQESGTVVKPLLALTGHQSNIPGESYQRIQSPAAWESLWLTVHPAPTVLAEVDFDHCMAIAMFQVWVHSIVETSGQLTFRVKWDERQTGLTTSPDEPTEFHGAEPDDQPAWGIFVVPKSAKRVVIEMDTSGLLDGPPVWTKRVELEAGDRVIERLGRPDLVSPP